MFGEYIFKVSIMANLRSLFFGINVIHVSSGQTFQCLSSEVVNVEINADKTV